MISKLDNDNFDSTLTSIFEGGSVAVVFYGTENCFNCQQTIDNIYFVLGKGNDSNTFFFHIDALECWIPEERYSEISEMMEYPRTIVYHGSFVDPDFYEGVVSIERIKEFQNLSQKS